ncbi:MAG: hypothetical protein NW200_08950 [Hyphomonadaceae bacterium]|nr:hypothetical protein [Hyphomonadaceae bacterium]
MVGNSGKRGNLAAVDTSQSYARRIETDQDRLHAYEEREWRNHIRRERSGAYWFAATKWGIMGLVAGIILGGVGMYYASISTLDIAQEAVTKGAMFERVRQENELQRIEPAPAPPGAP